VATTLQQLLDDLTARSGARPVAATIEDVTGALAHLGRALSGLADDGLTPGNSSRQRAATELAAACTTAGRLWPHSGGPLTDLAGAAADLIGRDRDATGRSHRWAVTVELAEAADTCAALGRQLLPHNAAPELAAVRTLTGTIERDAQADPPTTAGSVILDRLVPQAGTPRGPSEMTAPDASAVLVAALDRAQRTDELTLRGFRAAIAAAEITSRSAAEITAATSGNDAGPLLVTGLAWQLAGRTSMVFDDGRPADSLEGRGVIVGAQALAAALRRDVGHLTDLAARGDDRDLPRVVGRVQQVTGQLPVLADQLRAAVDRWSRTGRLYANARDLPPMDDMPSERVAAVIAGRHVRASGADLDRLRQVVDRAGALCTALADVPNGASPPDAPIQRHLTGHYAEQVRGPGAPERLLSQVQAVEKALATGRITPMAGRRHTTQPGPPVP
jgi:hypothetical protein